MYAQPGAVVEDVELVVSELVTNSVRAGAELIGLVVEGHHHELIIKANDDAPGWPEMSDAVGPLDSGGRGLRFVAAVSAGWGVLPEPVGKTVWTALPVHPEAAPGFVCLKRAS